MYQKIQKIRLRKMRSGPDRMKKSQKLIGAKIPASRRPRPTRSKINASTRNRTQRSLGLFLRQQSIAGPVEMCSAGDGMMFCGVQRQLCRIHSFL